MEASGRRRSATGFSAASDLSQVSARLVVNASLSVAQRAHHKGTALGSELVQASGAQAAGVPWDIDRARSIRRIVICLVSISIGGLPVCIFTLFAVPLTDFLDIDLTQVAYAFSIMFLFFGITNPVFATVSDMFGLRVVLLFAAGIAGATGLWFSVLTSVVELYIVYFLLGLLTGALCVPNMLICVSQMPPGKQGVVAGLCTVAFPFSAAVVSVLVTRLIESRGVGDAYLAIGVTSCFVLLVAALAYPADDVPQKSEDQSDAGQQEQQQAQQGQQHEQGAAAGAEASAAQQQQQGQEQKPQDLEEQRQDQEEKHAVGQHQRGFSTRAFVQVYVATFFGSATLQAMLMNLQPILEASWQPGSAVLQSGATVSFVVNCVGRLAWGKLTDDFAASRVMAASCAMVGLGLALFATTLGSEAGLLAVAVLSFAYPAYLPVLPVLSLQTFSNPLVYGWLMTAEVFASFAAPVVAAVSELVGWRSGLLLLTAVPVMQALCVLTLPAQSLELAKLETE